MPEGPFGQLEVRGPLSDEGCRMVIFVRGIGVPRDEEEKSQMVLNLVDSIAQSGQVSTRSSGKLIYANIPTRSNVLEIVVGLRDETFIPDQIERSYNTVVSKVQDLDSVSRIGFSHVTCGDPKEVLESKASATRF